jgi:hypothetical protein
VNYFYRFFILTFFVQFILLAQDTTALEVSVPDVHLFIEKLSASGLNDIEKQSLKKTLIREIFNFSNVKLLINKKDRYLKKEKDKLTMTAEVKKVGDNAYSILVKTHYLSNKQLINRILIEDIPRLKVNYQLRNAVKNVLTQTLVEYKRKTKKKSRSKKILPPVNPEVPNNLNLDQDKNADPKKKIEDPNIPPPDSLEQKLDKLEEKNAKNKKKPGKKKNYRKKIKNNPDPEMYSKNMPDLDIDVKIKKDEYIDPWLTLKQSIEFSMGYTTSEMTVNSTIDTTTTASRIFISPTLYLNLNDLSGDFYINFLYSKQVSAQEYKGLSRSGFGAGYSIMSEETGRISLGADIDKRYIVNVGDPGSGLVITDLDLYMYGLAAELYLTVKERHLILGASYSKSFGSSTDYRRNSEEVGFDSIRTSFFVNYSVYGSIYLGVILENNEIISPQFSDISGTDTALSINLSKRLF